MWFRLLLPTLFSNFWALGAGRLTALLRLAKSGRIHLCGGFNRCSGAALLDVEANRAADAGAPVGVAAPQVHLHAARRRRGEAEDGIATDQMLDSARMMLLAGARWLVSELVQVKKPAAGLEETLMISQEQEHVD